MQVMFYFEKLNWELHMTKFHLKVYMYMYEIISIKHTKADTCLKIKVISLCYSIKLLIIIISENCNEKEGCGKVLHFRLYILKKIISDRIAGGL